VRCNQTGGDLCIPMEPIRPSWLARSIRRPAVQPALPVRHDGSVHCLRGEFRWHGTSISDTARRLARTTRISNGSFFFVCLPPHVYQKAGAITIRNGPELNAEFDLCTFTSDTAGACVSSLRRICVRSTQPNCVCIDSSVYRPAPFTLDWPSGVVVANCRFESNRMVTAVRMRFAHGC
jgi:hypothetical protein